MLNWSLKQSLCTHHIAKLKHLKVHCAHLPCLCSLHPKSIFNLQLCKAVFAIYVSKWIKNPSNCQDHPCKLRWQPHCFPTATKALSSICTYIYKYTCFCIYSYLYLYECVHKIAIISGLPRLNISILFDCPDMLILKYAYKREKRTYVETLAF